MSARGDTVSPMYPANFITTAGSCKSSTSIRMEKMTPRMGGLLSRFLKKPSAVVRVPSAVPER